MQPWLKKMLTTCGVPADGGKHVRRKIGGRFCLGAVFFVIPAMLLDLPLWGCCLPKYSMACLCISVFRWHSIRKSSFLIANGDLSGFE